MNVGRGYVIQNHELMSRVGIELLGQLKISVSSDKRPLRHGYQFGNLYLFSKSVFSESVSYESVLSEIVFSESVVSESVVSENVFSNSVFSESIFSESVFSKSVFSESVFPESVFSKSVFILSVFLRNVLDLRVFKALRVDFWDKRTNLNKAKLAPKHPTQEPFSCNFLIFIIWGVA